MFADVRRGLALAAVVDGATVTDTDGNVIDTTEFFGYRRRGRRRSGREVELRRKRAEADRPMTRRGRQPTTEAADAK